MARRTSTRDVPRVGVLDVVLGGSKRARRVAKVRQNTREERVARVRDVRAPRGVARGTVRKRRAAFEVDDERNGESEAQGYAREGGSPLRRVRRRRRVERDSPQPFRAGESSSRPRVHNPDRSPRARAPSRIVEGVARDRDPGPGLGTLASSSPSAATAVEGREMISISSSSAARCRTSSAARVARRRVPPGGRTTPDTTRAPWGSRRVPPPTETWSSKSEAGLRQHARRRRQQLALSGLQNPDRDTSPRRGATFETPSSSESRGGRSTTSRATDDDTTSGTYFEERNIFQDGKRDTFEAWKEAWSSVAAEAHGRGRSPRRHVPPPRLEPLCKQSSESFPFVAVDPEYEMACFFRLCDGPRRRWVSRPLGCHQRQRAPLRAFALAYRGRRLTRVTLAVPSLTTGSESEFNKIVSSPSPELPFRLCWPHASPGRKT